jgi:hypothetical protein
MERVLGESTVHPWTMAQQGAKWRACHDYSVGTNRRAASAPFALPTVWDVRPLLKPSSRFAKYDLRDGFYLVPVHPDSRHRLVMRHPGTGRLMWCSRLPFGYLDSPRLFCSVTESLAAEFRRRVAGMGIYCIVFVDDWLVIGDDEAGLARAKAREASEARRKALALKIAKQNQELQERLALVKAVTDTDVTDDDGGAVQAASEKAAADSKARRKAEAEKIAKHAADMKAKIKNTAARTDDDLTDEAVFDAGKQMAADLEAKKGAKAEALSKANAAQKERLSKVAAVTDDDISDEKAWEARAKLGDESEERREAEAKKLAEENAEYRALIEGATAKVDDDITDEPAGMARKVA